MTDEQKTHEDSAGKFADALGGIEGRTKPLDKWEQREAERHALHKRDVESAEADRDADRRDHEQHILHSAEQMEMDRRAEERAKVRDALWIAELQHVQRWREREVIALERIATVLGASSKQAPQAP